jgi:hypothetical protein
MCEWRFPDREIHDPQAAAGSPAIRVDYPGQPLGRICDKIDVEPPDYLGVK